MFWIVETFPNAAVTYFCLSTSSLAIRIFAELIASCNWCLFSSSSTSVSAFLKSSTSKIWIVLASTLYKISSYNDKILNFFPFFIFMITIEGHKPPTLNFTRTISNFLYWLGINFFFFLLYFLVPFFILVAGVSHNLLIENYFYQNIIHICSHPQYLLYQSLKFHLATKKYLRRWLSIHWIFWWFSVWVDSNIGPSRCLRSHCWRELGWILPILDKAFILHVRILTALIVACIPGRRVGCCSFASTNPSTNYFRSGKEK